MIRVVAFDLGGVFFMGKGLALNDAKTTEWAARLGVSPQALSRRVWDGPDIEAANIGALSAEEYAARAAARLQADAPTLLALLESLFSEPLNHELVAYARRLKDRLPLAALTNNWSFGRRLLQRQGILDLFDPIVSSAEVGLKKPDPEIYRLLLDRLALPAEAVAFVDDVEENIRAAEAFGIRGILFGDTREGIAALERLLDEP